MAKKEEYYSNIAKTISEKLASGERLNRRERKLRAAGDRHAGFSKDLRGERRAAEKRGENPDETVKSIALTGRRDSRGVIKPFEKTLYRSLKNRDADFYRDKGFVLADETSKDELLIEKMKNAFERGRESDFTSSKGFEGSWVVTKGGKKPSERMYRLKRDGKQIRLNEKGEIDENGEYYLFQKGPKPKEGIVGGIDDALGTDLENLLLDNDIGRAIGAGLDFWTPGSMFTTFVGGDKYREESGDVAKSLAEGVLFDSVDIHDSEWGNLLKWKDAAGQTAASVINPWVGVATGTLTTGMKAIDADMRGANLDWGDLVVDMLVGGASTFLAGDNPFASQLLSTGYGYAKSGFEKDFLADKAWDFLATGLGGSNVFGDSRLVNELYGTAITKGIEDLVNDSGFGFDESDITRVLRGTAKDIQKQLV